MKAETVGELIELLKQFPLETPLESAGADCGGYDVCLEPGVQLLLRDGVLLLSHDACERD